MGHYIGFRDYTKDPNIRALKRRGCIHHGSTLGIQCSVSRSHPPGGGRVWRCMILGARCQSIMVEAQKLSLQDFSC